MEAAHTLLEGQKITKTFGGLMALHEVDFAISEGEILGLIGPNGAGKTTLFNLIASTYQPASGCILFRGRDITGKKQHQICRMGIARTYQLVRPFNSMSVRDNVLVGARFGRGKKSGGEDEEVVDELLDFFSLAKKGWQMAHSLTMAEMRRLEMARALATMPVLLLLDEVVSGLNPRETNETMELINRIRQRGITIFMIEHVMRAVMGLSDRVVVLHHGKKIADGAPDEISNEPGVINAYLGETGDTGMRPGPH